MRQIVVALVLVLSVVAPHGSASAAAADTTVYPILAGTTTISSPGGVAGIKMQVPREVLWRRGNISFELAEGTRFVWAAIRNQHDWGDACDLCFYGTFATTNEERYQEDPALGRYEVGGCDNDGRNEVGCPVPPGVIELYVVGDGPFTFTMRYPELQGALDVAASGDVDGVVERLPEECKVDDCSVVGGGLTHDVGLNGRKGFTGVVSWVYTDPEDFPTQLNTVACAGANASGYPYGCDVANPTSLEILFWTPQSPTQYGVEEHDRNPAPRGAQYLGFTTRAMTSTAPARLGAYGWWLNEGIACPSGNFFDC